MASFLEGLSKSLINGYALNPEARLALEARREQVDAMKLKKARDKRFAEAIAQEAGLVPVRNPGFPDGGYGSKEQSEANPIPRGAMTLAGAGNAGNAMRPGMASDLTGFQPWTAEKIRLAAYERPAVSGAPPVALDGGNAVPVTPSDISSGPVEPMALVPMARRAQVARVAEPGAASRLPALSQMAMPAPDDELATTGTDEPVSLPASLSDSSAPALSEHIETGDRGTGNIRVGDAAEMMVALERGMRELKAAEATAEGVGGSNPYSVNREDIVAKRIEVQNLGNRLVELERSDPQLYKRAAMLARRGGAELAGARVGAALRRGTNAAARRVGDVSRNISGVTRYIYEANRRPLIDFAHGLTQ